MPADIEESAKLLILAAQHHDVVTAEVRRNVVANIRDVVNVTHELPTAQEQRFVFEFEELCVSVSPWRQRVAKLRIVFYCLNAG